MTHLGVEKNKFSVRAGFTIVEIIVVITVIGILTAITVVSYVGISQKVIAAALQSDLSDAAGQLKLYQADNYKYPNSVTDCPSPSAGNMCLKTSSGNVISSYTRDNTAFPQKYSLTAFNPGMLYKLTQNTSPTLVTPASLNPTADWVAVARGDHYGTFYDIVGKQTATVARSTQKTIYDSTTNHIYDVPANYVGINPRIDGKTGAEAVIEDSRSNYILNSYGASNTSGKWDSWSFNSGAVGSPTYSITPGVYKSTAQRIQYTGVAGDSASPVYQSSNNSDVGTFSAGDTAVGTVYMKGSAQYGCIIISVIARDSGGAGIGEVYYAPTLTNTYQRFTLAYQNLPSGTSSVQLRIYEYFSPGEVVDLSFDAAQIEKGGFATSYIPTTTTSLTRNYDSVTVPTSGWNADTFAYVAVANMPPASSTTNSFLLRWGSSSGDDSNMFYANWDSTWYSTTLQQGRAGSSPYSSTGGIYSPANYHTYTVSSALGGTQRSYFDTVHRDADDNPASVNTMQSPGSTAKIGSAINNGAFNAPIQRIVVYNSQLSDADITTVTNAVKDGY